MHIAKIQAKALFFLFFCFIFKQMDIYAHHGNTDTFLNRATQPEKFEEFVTTNLKNQKIRLSDFQGNVIFLNFWATWCIPCKKEMPDMKRLEEKFKDRAFVILTVNMQESSEKIKKFYADLNLSFETALDPDGKIFNMYKVNQLPVTYIIDKQGMVVARAVGPRLWDSERSFEYFRHLLADKGKP